MVVYHTDLCESVLQINAVGVCCAYRAQILLHVECGLLCSRLGLRRKMSAHFRRTAELYADMHQWQSAHHMLLHTAAIMGSTGAPAASSRTNVFAHRSVDAEDMPRSRSRRSSSDAPSPSLQSSTPAAGIPPVDDSVLTSLERADASTSSARTLACLSLAWPSMTRYFLDFLLRVTFHMQSTDCSAV
jgi:hypothetical protein